LRAVFLDIDGVLVNRNSLRKHSGRSAVADPPCVEALNRVLKETEAVIVVSSVWRLSGLKSVRYHLRKWKVKGKILGITPDLTRVPNDPTAWVHVERGDEIADFLARHPKIDRFVILDDDSDMAHLKHRHIKTEFEAGLTEADADKAIRLMFEDSECLKQK
jgi:hypothetical protein